MKQKILSSDKDIKLEKPDECFDNALSSSVEKIDTANIYWLTYSYPYYCYSFMPMADLTFVFDELTKMVKKWLAGKGKRAKHL
ncbi:hypothetical protein [Flavobacterium johnsoniae]|uniref:Uncharacterized protein n=1 Tax=Flavobacterium johnsoniae TaxID=986 RepID=A0A1J7CEN5_FLAJO|nr:hypothetical protein [Flavobacterium johnsoniae]OIV39992.1 hypothetical protein BKM63_21575 [Flavobacterium johnsoniae]